MRYALRRTIRNNTKTYEKVFEKRGLKRGAVHFATPKLAHPTTKQISKLTRITHVWKFGDRYYKLAHEHYGYAKYWWIIAWYNKRPTESHLELGDLVYIPQPLEDIMRYLGV